MDILTTSANIASLLCVPATVVALPGIIFMISARMRTWFDAHRIVTPIYAFMIFISAAALVVARLGWLDKAPPILIPVHERTFDNEVVLLDGMSFYRCKCNNIKFFWNGGDFRILQSVISGTKVVETKNDLILYHKL